MSNIKVKKWVALFIGIMGGAITHFVGGFDAMLIAMCIVMVVDYLSGVAVAFVFHNSPKTESGKASSQVCLHGIFKKIFMLLLVGVGNYLDAALGIDFIRSGVIYAFLSAELLSLLENASLMGLPVPDVFKKALDVLNKEV